MLINKWITKTTPSPRTNIPISAIMQESDFYEWFLHELKKNGAKCAGLAIKRVDNHLNLAFRWVRDHCSVKINIINMIYSAGWEVYMSWVCMALIIKIFCWYRISHRSHIKQSGYCDCLLKRDDSSIIIAMWHRNFKCSYETTIYIHVLGLLFVKSFVVLVFLLLWIQILMRICE